MSIAPCSSSQISARASRLRYNRASQEYTGNVRIKNVTNAAVNGPFYLLITALTPNVTLVNLTAYHGNVPYITVPDLAVLDPGQVVTVPDLAVLDPGQVVSVPVRFSNLTNVDIEFTPEVFVGSLN
jgi:hypothetical protein